MVDVLRRNGYPEAEVIVGFADGLSYSKAKLEEALRIVLDRPAAAKAKASAFKKEDVDLLVNELDISRGQAEKALAEHDGDVQKALHSLVFS
ncbi:hypothetical protein K488DRAFT_84392 [Vararia minispora EC-137]|uniref:Uncharacterized protein n=1 Tax=Vararia minispora EC-137 TaxID=1314806 RepID=A0ACB8QR89_9AGAM|nr:hypothetical protein K488DRAFT_84392 [Vararia minispora EC-137]